MDTGAQNTTPARKPATMAERNKLGGRKLYMGWGGSKKQREHAREGNNGRRGRGEQGNWGGQELGKERSKRKR